MHVGPRRGRTKDVHHSCLTSAVTHRLLSLRGTIAPNLPPLQPLLPFPLSMTVTLQWPETPGDTAMLLSYHRITEPLRLAKTSKITKSNHPPMPTFPLSYVPPQCHINTLLEHLQEQWLHPW